MKGAKQRMTLAQYLQSTNLRRKVQSLSKSKDKIKHLSNDNLFQEKNKIDFLALQQNRKVRTQFQKYIQQLKLACRQIIKKDSQYIRILRLIQNLNQIFQKQMQQFRKDNSFLKSYLLQASFLNGPQQTSASLKKSLNHEFNSHQKQIFHNNSKNVPKNLGSSFQKEVNQNNLKIDVISECPRLSLMSKFDENKKQQNQFIENNQNVIKKFQPPLKINIKLPQNAKFQNEDFLIIDYEKNLEWDKQKKSNPQHSTNQHSQSCIAQNINLQSPTKKSFLWQQSSNNKKIATNQKEQSDRQMFSLHTPSTFHKHSQNIQTNQRRYQFSDRQNSISIRRYQQYKRNRNIQVNKRIGVNYKTSTKEFK